MTSRRQRSAAKGGDEGTTKTLIDPTDFGGFLFRTRHLPGVVGIPFVTEFSFSRLLNTRIWAEDYGEGGVMRSQQFHAADFATLEFIEQFETRDAQRLDLMSICSDLHS